MKNIFLVTLMIFSILFINKAWAGSFGQRWGANSHITNLPLFFQTQIYNDGSAKKTQTIVTPTRTLQQCATNGNTLSNGKNSQKNKVAFSKIKTKQNILERQKKKLHNKITDLEKEEYALTQSKKEIELIITG